MYSFLKFVAWTSALAFIATVLGFLFYPLAGLWALWLVGTCGGWRNFENIDFQSAWNLVALGHLSATLLPFAFAVFVISVIPMLLAPKPATETAS